MIPWHVGQEGRGEHRGLTGVEFASNSAVFHALQSKTHQIMRKDLQGGRWGSHLIDAPPLPSP